MGSGHRKFKAYTAIDFGSCLVEEVFVVLKGVTEDVQGQPTIKNVDRTQTS